MNKRVIIMGGGTFSYVRSHLALAAPAFGNTARQLSTLCGERFDKMDVELVLTKMADSNSSIVTNDDVEKYIDGLLTDNTIKVIIFNVAMCDFDGQIDSVPSGKTAERMQTKEFIDGYGIMNLTPTQKIINKIRQHRKDIFLVGFKTTAGKSMEEQYAAGLNLLKKASCNLVFVNDIISRSNMIITPEEGVYQTNTREQLLVDLVDMIYHRTHLSFTRSTVVSGEPVRWESAEVPATLREVVDYCIQQGAYRRFNGVTTGHFAAKLTPTKFLTSIRKTDFNKIKEVGLVRVETDGPDNVISYGAKPSVGGQSQRIVFNNFPDTDCIVHFHCPLRDNTQVAIPVMSQREYECGSHECGENTARGLTEVEPGIYAVMLSQHGPNIVFNQKTSAKQVIDFINKHFDLTNSTSGFTQAYLPLNT